MPLLNTSFMYLDVRDVPTGSAHMSTQSATTPSTFSDDGSQCLTTRLPRSPDGGLLCKGGT
eukprot:4130782-Amphidinium_carterae.1